MLNPERLATVSREKVRSVKRIDPILRSESKKLNRQ
jgi:hypothetical protein